MNFRDKTAPVGVRPRRRMANTPIRIADELDGLCA